MRQCDRLKKEELNETRAALAVRDREIVGARRTKTGRLWAYVREDRPAADETPLAVWFRYSPDRKGAHPQAHLKGFRGVLQADAIEEALGEDIFIDEING